MIEVIELLSELEGIPAQVRLFFTLEGEVRELVESARHSHELPDIGSYFRVLKQREHAGGHML